MGCHANIIVVDYDQGAAPFDGLERPGCSVDTAKPGDEINQAVEANGARIEPGDSAESLIARARDNLA